MKVKIFKGISKTGKEYWSIPARNYKDQNDKITYFVNFAKCGIPITQTEVSKNGKKYEFADIDVLEMAFGCYNHNPQLSIFKFKQQGSNETEMFGGSKSNSGENLDIQPEELPFY